MYSTIVLSGGGLKGFAQLGALWWASDNGYLRMENIKEYVGTSIGSIICLLLCAGYTPFELFRELYKIDVLISEDAFVEFREIYSKWGIISMQRVVRVAKILLESKLKIADASRLTFQGFYERTGILLKVIAVNISKMCSEVFSHATTPKLSVLDGVAMSSNIPIIGTKISYKKNLYIDGGVLENFPISFRESPGRVLAISTGFRSKTCETCVSNFLEYAYRLVFLPVSALTENRINEAGTSVHILHFEAPAFIVATKHDQEESIRLFSLGVDAMKEYMQNFRTLTIEGIL